MAKFNEILSRIEKRVNLYLEFKVKTGLVENSNHQKFWRSKLLVDVETWEQMSGKFTLKIILQHMPKEFVKNALPLLFDLSELHRADYTEWYDDYFVYLIEICKESKEGLWDRLTKF